MWTKLLESDKAIRAIFEATPNLENITLREINISENGPLLVLRMDLNEYPRTPPTKWRIGNFNTVQITMEFWQVSGMKMSNWGTDNIVNIELSTLESGYALRVNGSIDLYCEAKLICLGKISAYQNDIQ